MADLLGLPVIENKSVPEGAIFLVGNSGATQRYLLCETGMGVRIHHLVVWADRCPVLSMSPQAIADYQEDPVPLTPGEWLHRRREIVRLATRQTQVFRSALRD